MQRDRLGLGALPARRWIHKGRQAPRQHVHQDEALHQPEVLQPQECVAVPEERVQDRRGLEHPGTVEQEHGLHLPDLRQRRQPAARVIPELRTK